MSSARWAKGRVLGSRIALGGWGSKGGVFFQVEDTGRDAGRHDADGRRAGQAGRLDGGAVHKAGGRLPDEEVVPWLVGATGPQSWLMVWRRGRSLTARPALARISARPAAVVAVASLSSMSMEVGPTSRLPWTVGVTNTPLPVGPGSWKMVWRT